MLVNCKNLFIYLFITIGICSVSMISASEPPKAIEFEGSTLMLNGKGTRVVFFMKVYEGSLYLETKNADADEIINNSSPMALRIDVISEMERLMP